MKTIIVLGANQGISKEHGRYRFFLAIQPVFSISPPSGFFVTNRVKPSPRQAYASLTAHQSGHLLYALQRERRLAKRLHGNAHKLHGVIIRRNAVRRKSPTPATAVDDRPFTAFSYPYCHGLHDTAAVGFPVSGFHVYMQARKAVWTMVAMIAPCPHGKNLAVANLTGKYIIAGMSFKIPFLILPAFIFSVHAILPPKS
jgi:hypothetical protein